MISSDSCNQLVAGNYDVTIDDSINDSSDFKSILHDYLERFEQHESELGQTECGYVNEFKLLKEFSKTLKEDKSNFFEAELNCGKNRYKDILPFNHTRVVLNKDPLEFGSDYINANFIRGSSGSPKTYIACQGPLQCTLIDFWRMIWECNVSVIVMACNEFESDKPKCEIYWPERIGSSQCYGDIQVSLVKVRQICSDFLIRKFAVKLLQKQTTSTTQNNETVYGNSNSYQTSHEPKIVTSNNNINNNNNNINSNFTSISSGSSSSINSSINNDNNQQQLNKPKSDEMHKQYTSDRQDVQGRTVLSERTICQFHYTTWPDHGVPDSVQPILELVRLVREVQPAEDRPIVVHCSAGCGRTGTICCIDFVWGMLKRGKLDPRFDLCSIISEMRQQRMAMVQTIEQYILCHRAIAALFMRQLDLIDSHIYENLDSIGDEKDNKAIEEKSSGTVFI